MITKNHNFVVKMWLLHGSKLITFNVLAFQNGKFNSPSNSSLAPALHSVYLTPFAIMWSICSPTAAAHLFGRHLTLFSPHLFSSTPHSDVNIRFETRCDASSLKASGVCHDTSRTWGRVFVLFGSLPGNV